MAERNVTVKNPHGLHARPAALFVQKASSFSSSSITVVKDGQEVDAKSILAILSLGVEPGTTITIRADGDNAEKAIAELAAICEDTSI
ncbi:HPr family phosphocarrier protein [Acetomicrobium sp. S15 = DSM 107314]|jgi:phosphocarrier protein|uniref:HPr family phosphocarrier protein n=1 Tax=Acetomicrobium sp. S15 = DSM 107314 TaxID=2529858 RepID=UPI0018E1636B|nr:HPr family phosphocarrier protein [Acetomicrobium sp. S15 = DSM 107314]